MVVYSDELCHWVKGSVGKNHKYLKREWKNGRWHYYYSTNYDKSLRGTARRLIGADARGYANEKIGEYERSKANADGYNEIQADPIRKKYYTQSKANELREDADLKGKLARQAIDRYYKTPLGQVQKAKDMIENGRNKVADILSSASKKIRPSKSQYF